MIYILSSEEDWEALVTVEVLTVDEPPSSLKYRSAWGSEGFRSVRSEFEPSPFCGSLLPLSRPTPLCYLLSGISMATV